MRSLMIPLTVLTAAAALLLTVLGARFSAPRLGYAGGACFSLFLAGALVLGLDETWWLLFSLLFLCASRAGRKEGRP